MESSLVVIGINYRTAPVAVRERFWISPHRRADTLKTLIQAEGVDEVVVLATCNRTEFVIWASDPTLAASSVLAFLTREYGLKLSEWVNFYRLLAESALQHIFCVASGLDTMVLGQSGAKERVHAAWECARNAGTTGTFLDSTFLKSREVAERAILGSGLEEPASVALATAELAAQAFSTMEGRKVLLFGAGSLAELVAQHLILRGASIQSVVSRSYQRAAELALRVGGMARDLHEYTTQLQEADLVVSCTSAPKMVLTREAVAAAMEGREGAPLLLIDLAVPRDVDPRVRELPGVSLYDVDDLLRVAPRESAAQKKAREVAEQLISRETKEFYRKFRAERAAPAIQSIRVRLEEIGKQELEAFRRDSGPFTQDYDKMLEALTARLVHRIAGTLARELKSQPAEHQDKDTAGQRATQPLPLSQAVAAGTR